MSYNITKNLNAYGGRNKYSVAIGSTNNSGGSANRIFNYCNRTSNVPFYCMFGSTPGPNNKDIFVDNFVIGAGIGGTYLSSRLINAFPNKSLLLVDKLNDYGGLQTSSKIQGTNIYIDLGPIRFYPSIHPRISNLVEKLNIPIIEYLPNSDGQVYYLRGKKFNNDSNIFTNSEEVYNIDNYEKNENPFDTLTNNIQDILNNEFGENIDLSLLENRINLFKNKKLSNSVFQTLSQQELSQENWNRIQDMLGYNDLLSVKINFITDALEFVSLSSKNAIQYRLENGYSSLTKEIAIKNKLNKIFFNDLNKLDFNIHKYNTLFNSAVSNVTYSNILKKWIIKICNVNVNSPEDISYSTNNYKTIYADTIYSTIPLLYLKNIHNFSNEYLNICENSFVNFQIMRIYIRFEGDNDWLSQRNIGFGKSITTLNGAQLIHYANNILMFYAFNTQGSKLFGLLPDNIQIQKDMITPDNIIHGPLIDECRIIISKTYDINDSDIPNINGIAYASWIHPIRCFSGRNLQNLKNESLYDTLMKIMFPYGMNGKFYILENNTSFNAAWCEGSLEIVDFFFNLIYKTDLFGNFINYN